MNINQINLNDNNEENDINEIRKDDFAIIGMHLKTSLAEDINEFWENIKNGKDCIRKPSESRKKEMEKSIPYLKRAYTDLQINENDERNLEAGYMDDIDKFDYNFFKISPKEASLMDPCQKIFLEVAYNALEDAGYGGEKLAGSKTGVYIGYSADAKIRYLDMISFVNYDSLAVSIPGNLSSIIPSRISYILDLKGPAMQVDTACSSSLVAVHLACQAIRNGDCDIAIAGGVRINFFPLMDQVKIGIESSDGRTKSFDDSSDGTGSGEGVAAIIIKPLYKAIRDKDNIYAVIKGSAINQDGHSMGITAPNGEAQKEVIVNASRKSDINLETIGYIEAHGTGTKLGDVIELDAISSAFKTFTGRKQFCAVGAVKTNIGHLFEASGIFSLIKAVLVLYNKLLPPSIHFDKPNQNINFEEAPVYFNDRLAEWEKKEYPRRAGVNSFGLSGTNCHVILEEAPDLQNRRIEKQRYKILTISGKTEEILKQLIKKIQSRIVNGKDLNLEDVCYTLNTGRKHLDKRIALVFRNKKELGSLFEYISDNDINKINFDGIFYGEHKIVPDNKKDKSVGEYTNDEILKFSERSNTILENFNECMEESENIKMINDICGLYIKGADINWDNLYKRSNLKRIALPVYPFEKKRSWIDIPDLNEDGISINENIFYTIGWEENKINKFENFDNSESILIIKDQSDFSNQLITKLKEDGINIIEVTYGEVFNKENINKFTICPDENDFMKLFSNLENLNISKIIFLNLFGKKGDIESLNELEENQKKGIYSFFYLSKILITQNIFNNIHIFIITDYANEITKTEKIIKPENAQLFGFGKVLEKENQDIDKKIKVTCLDIDENTNPLDIILELKNERTSSLIAFRDKKRYIEKFHEIMADEIEDEPVTIKEDGAYIVTGGLGGIGLEISKYLCSKNKIHLVFINRTKMPERELWDNILLYKKDEKICKKILSIKDIETTGSSVECFNADVSDQNQLKEIFSGVKNRYGNINGIIHSAGVPGLYKIQNQSINDMRNNILPKVNGTWLIHDLTKNDNLDFFVLFSSVATIFHMSGQSAYAAANSFLDSFAAYRNKKNKKTLVINWVAWKETGMAFDTKANFDTMFKAIPTNEAIGAFDKVLNKKIVRTLIGKLNFGSNIVLLIKRYLLKLSEKIEKEIKKYEQKNDSASKINKSTGNKIKIVRLLGNEDGIYTDNEKAVGQIWGEVLGYDEISIYDNFFELGGDSIRAAKMLNIINRTKSLNLTFSDIFNFQTIKDIAPFLEKLRNIGDEKNIIIEPSNERMYYPLTSAQKRIFVSCQINDMNTSYNNHQAFLLKGILDINKVNDVFKIILKRHEALRISFHTINGEIVQKINNGLNLNLIYKEIVNDEIDSTLRNFIQPFDLEVAPLIRLGIFKLEPEKCILIFDMHHIISDGISIQIIEHEFINLYEGRNIPELNLQYKDYAVWQQEVFNKSEEYERQGEYWLNMFSKKVPKLEMVTDYDRPNIKSYEGHVVSFELSEELNSEVYSFIKESETTLFILLYSIYVLLLFKYTGQSDIIVAVPVSGRNSINKENIIGMFVNTLAIRNHIESDIGFNDFLKELKVNVAKSFDNQDFQLDDLITRIKLERDPSRNPLFDTLFMLMTDNIDFPKVDFSSLETSLYNFNDGTVITDFEMFIYEFDKRNYFSIKYSCRLFKKETIEKFVKRYQMILEQVLINKNIAIKDIEVIEKYEKENVLSGINKIKDNINDIKFNF